MKAFVTKVWTIIKKRISSPVILIAFVAQILLAAKISPETLTSWPVLWATFKITVSNPLALGLILIEIGAFFNNPVDKKNF